LLHRSGDKRDVLADVPFATGVRVLWLGVASGWWGGISRVVKTASSRGRTGRTLFGRLATPDIRLASADAFAVVGGGCTGRAHGCKAKQGSRGKDGADVWLLLPQ